MILKIEQDPSDNSNNVSNEKPLSAPAQNQQDIDDSVQQLLQDPELGLLYNDAKAIRNNIDRTQIDVETLKQIKLILSEYLSNFVLIGYDILGRRLYLQSTPKPVHTDALQKYLEQVVNSGLVLATGNAQSANRPDDDDDDD